MLSSHTMHLASSQAPSRGCEPNTQKWWLGLMRVARSCRTTTALVPAFTPGRESTLSSVARPSTSLGDRARENTAFLNALLYCASFASDHASSTIMLGTRGSKLSTRLSPVSQRLPPCSSRTTYLYSISPATLVGIVMSASHVPLPVYTRGSPSASFQLPSAGVDPQMHMFSP